ncbi:MAG: ATP-grasp domain-containing protein [Promethearchaeota archaeon]|nr:MAG: ATP-grasp domain-containing protein [Candidatus Lokiarchaeota archaeon]
MVIWIIGAKSYESNRILGELEKNQIEVKQLNWTEIDLPLKEIPELCLIRYSKGMMDKQGIIFVLSAIEELQRSGCMVVPSIEGIYREDKMSIYLLWKRYLSDKIMMPDTLITKDIESARIFLDKKRVVVFKPLIGGLGKGVLKIDKEDQLIDLFKKYQVLFLQEYIQSPSYDIRTIVIGDKIILKYARYNKNDFKHNIHSGGEGKTVEEIAEFDQNIENHMEKIERMALDIKNIARLDMMGIDFLPSEGGFLYLLEWNSTFGFAGAESTTNIDVAKILTEYILSKLKK